MKYIRILLFTLFLAPVAAFAQTNEFMVAAQLLSAAKNADIQQVQILINSGADVNYIDKTGLSLVCTALMNNDVRAAQILQMYGADASQCDKQIKQYRSRTKTKAVTDGGGGLFGGLSSAQSLTLTAAGAAVVIGGLFLLTDVFDSDNGNDNGAANNGNRPNNNGGGENGGGNSNALFTLPYGPAMRDAATEASLYTTNLNALVTDVGDDTINKDTFTLMNLLGANSDGLGGQNYLLMMHGYSPMARGYMGMRTLRAMNNSPMPKTAWADYRVNGQGVEGGRPTGVGLITANGINAAPKPKGDFSAQQSSLDDVLLAWAEMNGNEVAQPAATYLSSKYYNNVINDLGQALDTYTSEDSSLVGQMDLSGFGTAVNNTLATNDDNLLAKIVGGRISGAATADFLGFMPNGQMAIFRTGGGTGMVDMTTPSDAGTYTKSEGGVLETITLADGTVLNVTLDGTKITAENTDTSVKYSGYIGADGLLYMANGDNPISAAYKLDSDNKLTQVKEADQIDFMNYQAMKTAIGFREDGAAGRSKLDVIANASVIDPLRSVSSYIIDDVLSAGDIGSNEQKQRLQTLVHQYYDKSDSTNVQALAAKDVFTSVGLYTSPLLVFSTGAYNKADTLHTRTASFENAAPLAYNNLEHLFMSVVAVSLTGNGTSKAGDVSGFSTSGNKFALSDWTTTDGKQYGARMCGVAGTGAGGIDPWCFAAAGITDEMAVASAAGAAGVVKSAFNNIKSVSGNSAFDNEMLFTLLALTADGAYLGTNPITGTSWGTGNTAGNIALASYLQNMYQLPTEIQGKVDAGEKDYLTAFKEVFGYGLINLERATKPGNSIYFYNGTDIISGSGNAYWRAATNTKFRTSAAFAPRASTISAPFFDVLESVDGEMSLPRVWENEFTIGASDRRGLYMGDVLGEFKTRRDEAHRTQIGNLGFSMATSQRAYDDNMSGLDEMRFDYNIGKWDLAAGYQRHFTDGASRFAGMSNPIFGLASNVVMSDAHYNMGRFSFGARAFSGAVTDESLLENDPTLSARFEPARLGRISGASTDAAFAGDKFAFNASIGTARESDTILGAQTGGLLNLGAGDTTYIDAEMRFSPVRDVSFKLRGTFARTASDATGDFILGMSDITSDAFAFGADIGNFSLGVSRPLGVTRGKMQYAHAEYDVVNNGNGKYELAVNNAHVADIDLSPARRELRFSGEYRHKLGEFTDGAIGFIYRVNPNHTSEFGNESIFMLKMTHRLGI